MGSSVTTRASIFPVNALPRFGASGEIPSHELERRLSHSGPVGLYVHIPYCLSICPFCMLRKGATARGQVPSEYVDALVREVTLVATKYETPVVDAVYFGGGTPSLLSPPQIRRIFDAIHDLMIARDAEVTFEGEAQSLLRPGVLTTLLESGVQRLSFGVQTFDAKLRSLLGRTDSVEQLWELREQLAHYDFADINIDLIYALPGQALSLLATDLCELDRYAVTSVDCHPLKYASCSRHLLQNIVDQHLVVPTAADRAAAFLLIRTWMLNHGYIEQFVDQYCKPALHGGNRYMQRLYGLNGGAYIGIGAGARSHLSNIGYRNIQNVNTYMEAVQAGCLPLAGGVEAPLSDNYITCFPKRNDSLRAESVSSTSCPAYFAQTLHTLASQGYLKFESACWRVCDGALSSYQLLQEMLLSPAQRENHYHSAHERSGRFQSFNHHFDAIGDLLQPEPH